MQEKPKVFDYTKECPHYCLKWCLRPKKCWQAKSICCHICQDFLLCEEMRFVCYRGEGRKT